MSKELNVVADSRKLFFAVDNIARANPYYKWTLNQQIIRAAISIGSNIVEGRRKSHLTFLNQIDIAIGSCEEVLYQLSLYAVPENGIIEAVNQANFIMGKLINLKKAVRAQGAERLAQSHK
jgi:four helix bundle protein